MTGHNKNKKSGFALLMALIVVSVVVSVGLTILELSLKQVRLSTNSRDSEIAFHAANAGLECARYWRVASENQFESGTPVAPSCFGNSFGTVNATTIPASGGGTAYMYEFSSTWGTPNRCSSMTILTINSNSTDTTVVSNMTSVIPGYLTAPTKECGPSGRCTIIAVKGYSRSCNDLNLAGTIEREVLLEL